MGAGEDGDVHWDADGVGLVQAHAEVTLATQQQQDEDADVHQADTRCKHHAQAISGARPRHT